MSETQSPIGGCPFCGFYPPGGFESYEESCSVCGVARNGAGHRKVPVGINEHNE